MKKIYFSLSLAASFLLLFPLLTTAGSVVSITPAATEIDSALLPESGGEVFGWVTEIGTEYEVVVALDDTAVVLVCVGGELSGLGWTDNGDGTATTNFTSVEMLDNDMELADGMTATLLNFEPAAEYGEGGPTIEALGTWLSTNVIEWEMYPPMEDDVSFGYSFTGPAGEEGVFKMFVPDSLVTFLGDVKGSPLTEADLAVFADDSQVTSSVDAMAGGLLVDLSLDFIEGSTTIAGKDSDSDGVTKKVTVEEKLPVSLAVKKASIKKSGKTRLYGWLKNGKKKQKVKLYRKIGKKKWKKWKTLTSKKNGYFTKQITVNKNVKYKAKYRKTKKKSYKISPVVSITATKKK